MSSLHVGKMRLFVDGKEIEGVVFGSANLEEGGEVVPCPGPEFDLAPSNYEVNIEMATDAGRETFMEEIPPAKPTMIVKTQDDELVVDDATFARRDPLPCGASRATLERRVRYGGRKGISAARRLARFPLGFMVTGRLR